MKFSLVTLYTKDMEPSLKFYRDVIGMNVIREIDIPGGKIAFLGEQGNVQLEIIAGDQHETPAGFSIGFDVEDMDAEMQRLEALGVKKLSGPTPAGGNAVLSFFEGPGGETVELVGEIKP